MIRLVNKELNEELLKECPYIDYLDLAVTFRYLVKNDMNGIATVIITNKEYEKWDIEKDVLYDQALHNTMQIFPHTVKPLTKVLLERFEEHECRLSKDILEELEQTEYGGELPIDMYVLTNDAKSFGAGVILYDDVIRDFAQAHESNVFILPSSVHEIMLVPENKDIDPKVLKELIKEANDSSVGLIDLLGDNIYYYEFETDKVSIYDAA